MTETELRKLAEAATPGPWKYQKAGDTYTHIVRAGENRFLVQFPLNQEGGNNARFIAASNPTAIVALLDEITALRAKVKSQATELKNQAMAWSNVLDLDLIPQQYRTSAEEPRRAAREAGQE